MKIFDVLFLLLVATFSSAQAQDCISKEDMTEIANHFTQFSELSGKEYCYNGSHESHLLAGLMFMRQTQFSMPMNPSKDELFSGKFASGWFNYFIGRIDTMEIDEGCPKGVAAYVYAFGGHTMYVCTMLLSDNFTAMDRASVFMHEARHIDGYPHITCRSGPRAGLQGACDNRISDGGSYAVTVETYAQLSRYALGIHPAMKAYARSSAVVYADETFETPARVERTSQFMVMTSDKRFHQVKANGSVTDLGYSPELGQIVMRGQHMVLVPTDKNHTARYVFAKSEGELPQQAGTWAEEYNAQSPAERANFVDMHVAAQWNAKITKTKVTFSCDPRSQATTDISFKAGDVPVGMVYVDGYNRSAPTAQLMLESGKMLDISCAGKSASLNPSSKVLDQKYKSLYKVGDLTLGLAMDGSIREIQGASSRPFALGKLDGQIMEIAPNQSVAFFNE